MASADILSAFSGVIIENAKRYIDSSISKKAPLANGEILKIEDTEGENYTFIVDDQANSSTVIALDGGLRPKAVGSTPQKGTARPSTVTTTMSLGRLAALAKMSDGEMGQTLHFKMKQAGKDCARTLERALHGFSVSPQAGTTWDATDSTATATVSFEDITVFEPNMLADFLDASGSKSYRVRVTGKTYGAVGNFSGKVAGTVSFKNDVVNPADGAVAALANTTIATGDSFKVAGYAAGFGGADTKITDIVSFDDICGSGAESSLHGISPSDVASWVSYRDNVNAPYTQEASLAFMALLEQESDEYPDIAILGNQLNAAHAAAAGVRGTGFGHMSAPAVDASVERTIDSKMDKYGNLSSARMEINGAKAIVSPLAPATKIRFCSSESTKLLKWTDIEPEMDSSGKPWRTDHDNIGVLVFLSGDRQLVTENRAAVGEMYGITSL